MAERCIEAGAHYLDLADARDFVAGIGRLDDDARRRGLMVASGVSSTPAITSAMIAELAPEFARIDEIHTALSPGKPKPARRGHDRRGSRATWAGRSESGKTASGSSGRAGATCSVSSFPAPVGRRRVHNCEVPELELFPQASARRRSGFPPGWS